MNRAYAQNPKCLVSHPALPTTKPQGISPVRDSHDAILIDIFLNKTPLNEDGGREYVVRIAPFHLDGLGDGGHVVPLIPFTLFLAMLEDVLMCACHVQYRLAPEPTRRLKRFQRAAIEAVDDGCNGLPFQPPAYPRVEFAGDRPIGSLPPPGESRNNRLQRALR
jgi:hypothetical protein